MFSMPSDENDVFPAWREPARQLHSREVKDLENYMKLVDKCRTHQTRRKMNLFWGSPALREWLGNTEKRICYLDGSFRRNGLPTADSYATAGITKFLFEKLDYPVLSYFVLPSQNEAKGIKEVDTLDMLRSLTAQLLNQMRHEATRIDSSLILKFMKEPHQITDDRSTLINIIHKDLARLTKDDAVYIIFDIGFAKCRDKTVEDIVNLTQIPGAIVKVLISQPDDANFESVKKSEDSMIYIEDKDIGDKDSSGIDLKGKTYQEWEDAMKGTPLSTGLRKNNTKLVRVEDGADSCWEARMDALAM